MKALRKALISLMSVIMFISVLAVVINFNITVLRSEIQLEQFNSIYWTINYLIISTYKKFVEILGIEIASITVSSIITIFLYKRTLVIREQFNKKKTTQL